MSYHARMLPTTLGTLGSQHDTRSATVRVAPLAPDDERDASMTEGTAPAVATPVAPESSHTLVATNAGEAAYDDARPNATPWPWYRREPWLAVALASFAPIGAGFALPQEFHYLLLGMSGVLVVLSIAMLFRQGPFREHPQPAQPVSTSRRDRQTMPVLSRQGVG
jgi:hypothetical protein